MKSQIILLFALFIFFTENTQGADQPENMAEQVLFTFGDDSVKLSAFEYVYNKNNINDQNSYSRESLEEYLQLYINFRLKVKEAEELGLDTVKSINDELETYRKQLAKSYLYDREVSEKLLKEAYDRLQYEVRASHILIPIDESGLPSDTLEAYNKAMKIRKRIMNGESFETLAKEFSSDPSVKTNGGDIGYFTALQTVYPFESAAFNTKAGEVSKPVKTRFGYHLVKVTDKRPAQGKITVAHILVKVDDDPTMEDEQNAQSKINTILERLKNGESFEELAKTMSEDKLTANKGGELPPFGTGKMVQEFETAAFALEEDGAISDPVRTEFGYHIIKRLDKEELPTFEESKGELKKRVERDSRSAKATHVLVDRIKKEYKFKDYPKNKAKLYNRIGDDLVTGRFVMKDKADLDKPLFELAGIKYSQKDFVEYLEQKQQKRRTSSPYSVYNNYYDMFVEQVSLDYEESQLEKKYPEFKALMQEYHDGILLFELTDQKVWSKAIKDTAGLKKYHEQNKTDYMWGERANAVIYTVKDEKTAKKVKKQAKKGKLTTEDILKKYNTEENPNMVKAKTILVEKGQNEMIDKLEWMPGISENIGENDEAVTFVHIKEIVAPTPKSLNEAKGFIVSDYQEYLEKLWIKELRNKYPVTINKEVFSTLIK